MNNKAFALDGLIFINYLAIIITTLVVTNFSSVTIFDRLNGTVFMNSIEAQTIATKVEGFYSFFDTLMPFLFFDLFFTLIVSLFFIRSNPVFFLAGVLTLIILVMYSGIFSITLLKVFQNSTLSTTFNNLVFSNKIISSLAFFVMLIFCFVLVVLYTKFLGGIA